MFMWALAYVDRAENAFQSQTAIARFLLGKSVKPSMDPAQRKLTSPIEGASEEIWRETVEAPDVERLIVGDIL